MYLSGLCSPIPIINGSLYHVAIFFCSFFGKKIWTIKIPSVVTHDVRPSVCPSACPSSVEISLEPGCTITNRSIDLKFDINIGGSGNACLKGTIF